jgi:hypothetical protein
MTVITPDTAASSSGVASDTRCVTVNDSPRPIFSPLEEAAGALRQAYQAQLRGDLDAERTWAREAREQLERASYERDDARVAIAAVEFERDVLRAQRDTAESERMAAMGDAVRSRIRAEKAEADLEWFRALAVAVDA